MVGQNQQLEDSKGPPFFALASTEASGVLEILASVIVFIRTG